MHRICFLLIMVLAGMTAVSADNKDVTMEATDFTRQSVRVEDGLMTPEVLWAMGRIGSPAAAPDGKHIAYQVD